MYNFFNVGTYEQLPQRVQLVTFEDMNLDRVNFHITQSVSHMKQYAIDSQEEFLQRNDSDNSSDYGKN